MLRGEGGTSSDLGSLQLREPALDEVDEHAHGEEAGEVGGDFFAELVQVERLHTNLSP